MALGTLVLLSDLNTGSARQSPTRENDLMTERWRYINADSTRSNDKITASKLTRIKYITGTNQDNYGSSASYTIDNSTFPPTVSLVGVQTGDGGIITLYGY